MKNEERKYKQHKLAVWLKTETEGMELIKSMMFFQSLLKLLYGLFSRLKRLEIFSKSESLRFCDISRALSDTVVPEQTAIYREERHRALF